MKYKHKCISCGREGNHKFKSRYFCDDCLKAVRRKQPPAIWVEELVYSIKDPEDNSSFGIYHHYLVKLK